jgi:PhoH-like ATPase
MKKTFLLDTNILIHDPYAFLNFDEHNIIIPMTVLEELDSLKDRVADVSKDARVAIRALEDVLEDAGVENIASGVPIKSNNGIEKGNISVFNDGIHILNKVLDGSHPDNSIINAALHFQALEKGKKSKSDQRSIVLVTKDINMRLKAKSAGLEFVEDYKNDQILTDASLMNKGYIEWTSEIRFWDQFEPIGEIIAEKTSSFIEVSKSALEAHSLTNGLIYPNTYIVDNENSSAMRVYEVKEETVVIEEFNYEKFMNQKAWNVTPKCFRQAASMHALLDPKMTLVAVSGAAGCGKTYLAVSAALQLVIEQKLYDKIIVTRSTPEIAEGIGFLPGTEEEKMAPWLAAIGDTMEVLHKNDEDPKSSIKYATEKSNMQFKSVNFMRGRSINNAVVILDEIQNLTASQLKTIFTRIGKNSKIIALGNGGQVDVKYLSKLNNGCIVTAETFKDFEDSAHISLNGVVRSKLAAFAEENM